MSDRVLDNPEASDGTVDGIGHFGQTRYRQMGKLTDVAIRKAKAAEKPYKMPDGNGLYLLVKPTGARLWRYDYRRPITGKRNTLAFGSYPEITLTEARDLLAAARKTLAQGTDPGEQKKTAERAALFALTNSLESVGREWWDMKKGEWTESTAIRALAWLENHVFPYLGKRPIEQIEAPELLMVLRKIASGETTPKGKRGKAGKDGQPIDTANRIRAMLSTVFRYAIATGRAKRDPAADLLGALPKPKKGHFAAITDPGRIGELMRSIEAYSGSHATRAALKLSPYLFQRPGELRGAYKTEFDLDAAEWRIPALRQKLRKAAKENPRTPDHIVPLSKQAVTILRDLFLHTEKSELVFPSDRDPKRPISENTVNAALRRMDYSSDEMTAHGFRHMASTLLNEKGWRADAIERQLAHADGNRIRGTYNQAQYLDERRRMMQDWADHLDELRDRGKVVPIRKAG